MQDLASEHCLSRNECSIAYWCTNKLDPNLGKNRTRIHLNTSKLDPIESNKPRALISRSQNTLLKLMVYLYTYFLVKKSRDVASYLAAPPILFVVLRSSSKTTFSTKAPKCVGSLYLTNPTCGWIRCSHIPILAHHQKQTIFSKQMYIVRTQLNYIVYILKLVLINTGHKLNTKILSNTHRCLQNTLYSANPKKIHKLVQNGHLQSSYLPHKIDTKDINTCTKVIIPARQNFQQSSLEYRSKYPHSKISHTKN